LVQYQLINSVTLLLCAQLPASIDKLKDSWCFPREHVTLIACSF